MTKKKLFISLLIVVLLVLFTAGMKEKDGIIPDQPDIVIAPAGVIDEGSSSVNEKIQPAEAAIQTETPPVVLPVSKQTETDEVSTVKDTIEEKKQPVIIPGYEQDPIQADPVLEEPHEETPDPPVHEHTWVDEIVAYHEVVTHGSAFLL